MFATSYNKSYLLYWSIHNTRSVIWPLISPTYFARTRIISIFSWTFPLNQHACPIPIESGVHVLRTRHVVTISRRPPASCLPRGTQTSILPSSNPLIQKKRLSCRQITAFELKKKLLLTSNRYAPELFSLIILGKNKTTILYLKPWNFFYTSFFGFAEKLRNMKAKK